MNSTVRGPQRSIIILFTVFAMCCLASGLNAQTKYRKKSTKKPVPVPVVQTEPLIISRAEDFPDPDAPQKVIEKLPEPNGTADVNARVFEDLNNRIKSLETLKKNDYDSKQRRLKLNLDILMVAESRAETLRKQLFDMIEKEGNIKTKLDQIENDIRPESIDRGVAFAGTLRPEELRNLRRRSLESERTNLQTLLAEVQRTRANLDLNLQKADLLVDKLRAKLEKEIDDALVDEPKDN